MGLRRGAGQPSGSLSLDRRLDRIERQGTFSLIGVIALLALHVGELGSLLGSAGGLTALALEGLRTLL